MNFVVSQHLLSYCVAVGAENVREEMCFLESTDALKNSDLAFGVKTGLNEHFDECPVLNPLDKDHSSYAGDES